MRTSNLAVIILGLVIGGCLVVLAESFAPLPELTQITTETASEMELLRRFEMPGRLSLEEMATAAFSPDGQLLAVAGMSRAIGIWDTISGELVHELGCGSSVGAAVAFSPDGSTLVSGDLGGRVSFWDVETGSRLMSKLAGSSGIHCLEYSPDGQRLLTVNIYDAVRVWSVADGAFELVSTFRGHGRRVNLASFSPDGASVVSGGGDNRARVWDAATGEESLELAGANFFIEGVEFSPDGSTIIGASDDSNLYLWDAESGDVIRSHRWHSSPVNGVAISADGALIASFSNSRATRVWDVATGESLANLSGHAGYVLRGAFNPQGTLIASVSRDGHVNLYGIPVPVETLALINGSLIDGTGAPPLADAVVMIQEGRIIAVGARSTTEVPADARIIDVHGSSILPGIINTHVHQAYSQAALRGWAAAGVTTVRDVGTFGLWTAEREEVFLQRDELNDDPSNARLISTGPLVTTVGGYGNYPVVSPDDARDKVNALIEAGADVIKIAIEDDLQGRQWPTLSLDEISAIVDAAHQRGVRVAAHVSRARHVELALAAGVDDVNHMAVDRISDELIKSMVQQGMFWVATLELWECVAQLHDAQNWLATAMDNVARFAAAGGRLALGTDYEGYVCEFDAGMPIIEMELMQQAGLTAMQILVAATGNAAEICGIGEDTGTIEVGKVADVIVVSGNPLDDLSAMERIQLVIRGGSIIGEE